MTTEIDQAALENVLQSIADKYCSEEDRINFSMTGQLQIELALEGSYPQEKSIVTDSDAFGIAEAKLAVEITSIIVGSIKALLEIKKLRNSGSIRSVLEDLQRQWTNRLTAEGIDPAKAQAIVAEFKNDFAGVFY